MPTLELPASYPKHAGQAYGQLCAKDHLELDDLRVLALVEASGKAGYGAIADLTEHQDIKDLLNKNGREEVGHAHRILKAIAILSGTSYELPADEDNPLIQPSPITALTPELVKMFIAAEMDGEVNYNRWADNESNPEVAKIYRLIGADERRHAGRAEEILALLTP